MTITDAPTALDLTAVRNWLTLLHGRSPGLIGISAAGDGRFTSAAFENVDDAVRHVEQLHEAGKAGIYCRVTTLRERPPQGRRGGAELSLAFPGLWADLDIAGPGHKTSEPLPPDEAAARRVVEAAGLPTPTRWIHSGGGLYPWWLLTEPHIIGEDRAELEALSVQWQAALARAAEQLGYHYGTGVGDLPRVLRVPGTVNRKAGLARPCVILPDDGPFYSLAELHDGADAITPAAPLPAAQPPALPPAPAESVWSQPMMNAGSPFDALAESVTWADLLTPHGWTLVGTERDGAELWKRPGATSPYSARCGHNGVPVMVVHSTDAGLPDGPGRHLTKGRVFAHLNHRGNESAAASDLRAAAAGDPTAGPARALPRRVLDHVAHVCGIRPWTTAAPTPSQDGQQSEERAIDPNRLVIRKLSDVAAEVDARPPRPWLFEPVWAAGDYGVMSAEDKAGKTWAILDAAISCAAEGAWLSRFPCHAGGAVLIFLGEGSDAKMIRRLRAIGAHKGLTREQVDALPILLCFRAPQLSREDHLAVIAATMEEYRPALLIIDPLYLAAGGANGADLYAMGALLGNIQHVAQTFGAALLIAHHWNKTGEGTGHSRSSGVGPGAWGRVLISIAVKSSRTDPQTAETAVWLKWSFKGDEIPETDTTFVRRVRAENPSDLSSPLHYSIEVDDGPTAGSTGGAEEKRSPAAAKILEALKALQVPSGTVSIGDEIARRHGTGLRRETMSRHLNALHKEGSVEREDLGDFLGVVWSLKTDKQGGDRVTDPPITPPVTDSPITPDHTLSNGHTETAGQGATSRVTEPQITRDHTGPCDVTAPYKGGHTGHTGAQSQQSQPSPALPSSGIPGVYGPGEWAAAGHPGGPPAAPASPCLECGWPIESAAHATNCGGAA